MTSLTRGVALLVVAGLSTAWHPTLAPGADDLVGTWRVDLRPTPDAEPYLQEFVVTSVEGGVLAGTFYGTPIAHGRVNADWGDVSFAFVTYDASGPYHHAGRLRDGRLEGSTYAVGRAFVLPWRAERAAE